MDWMIGFIDTYTFTQFGTAGTYSTVATLHTFQLTVAHALGFSVFSSRILATDLTQELLLQITMKSSCHFLFNPFGMLTLQNSTQFSNAKIQGQSYFATGVYRQSVCLGVKPLETHDQRFYFHPIEPLR
jgi:hypothetical protein